jgi:rfaE bifunctional protein kinase chain/domain
MLDFKKAIKDIKIVVIGDVMIDHYMKGIFERVSPEAPVPIVDVKSEYTTLGGAGNVLENLLALGVKAELLTIIGDDETGTEFCSLLEKQHISLQNIIKEKGRQTTKKSRVMVSSHQMMRIDKETKMPISASSEKALIEKLSLIIADVDLILLSDYAKGVLSNNLISEIVSLAKKHNKITLVDPKGKNYEKYRGVNIIKPNKKECIEASNIQIESNEDLIRAIHKIKDITQCDTVIVTLSEDGMMIYEKEIHHIPTKATAVYDVTGAGDTVLATIGTGIAAGLSIEDACVLANHAAAIVITKVGSATVSMEEIMNHIKSA